MTIDEIKELMQMFNESGVAELEVQRGENRLRLRRASLNQDYVVAPAPAPVVVAAAQAAIAAPPGLTAQPQAAPPPAATATATARAPEPDSGHVLVKSPIVGTYYDAPRAGRAAVCESRRFGGAGPSALHYRVDEAHE